MQWQGYIRQLSKYYRETIVFGRQSSSYFYRDFASEFKALDIESWDTNGYMLYGFDYVKWANDMGDKYDLLVADNKCISLREHFIQDFIPFGCFQSQNQYDLVIHARQIPSLKGNTMKMSRNWATECWDKLCLSLSDFKIAAVGIPELTYLPPNTTDLRGEDTEKLCSIIASSKCCIGPSSGLMHLASLCKTPHFVWTSIDATWGFGGTAYRYLRTWNPFATPVKILVLEGYQPKPELIRNELLKFLEEEQSSQNIIYKL